MNMNTKSLVVQDPQNALQVVESWAGMARDARKRRAAKASQDDDREDLRSLLDSYVLAFSRSRSDTSKRTIDTYWQGAKKLLNWCAENGRKPHAVAGEDISRFIASMHELLPKTRQVHLSGAKTMIKALRWAGVGKDDPFIMENGSPIQIRNPDKAEDKIDPFTVDEVKKLLEGANDRERALILLGVDGGLRLEEIQKLKWSGVDSDRNLLKFKGKGSKSAKVTVTDRVIAALEAMKNGDSDTVFKIGRRRLQQIFTRRCQDAGVKPRGIHSLRHSCGTRLYELTRDLLIVKRHLRHSSTVTSEIYAHLADGDYQEAVKMLESNGYA